MCIVSRVTRVPVDTSAVDTCVCYRSKNKTFEPFPTSSKGWLDHVDIALGFDATGYHLWRRHEGQKETWRPRPRIFGTSICKWISWQETDAIFAWIHEWPNAAANVENHCSHPSFFPIHEGSFTHPSPDRPDPPFLLPHRATVLPSMPLPQAFDITTIICGHSLSSWRF